MLQFEQFAIRTEAVKSNYLLIIQKYVFVGLGASSSVGLCVCVRARVLSTFIHVLLFMMLSVWDSFRLCFEHLDGSNDNQQAFIRLIIKPEQKMFANIRVRWLISEPKRMYAVASGWGFLFEILRAELQVYRLQ